MGIRELLGLSPREEKTARLTIAPNVSPGVAQSVWCVVGKAEGWTLCHWLIMAWKGGRHWKVLVY